MTPPTRARRRLRRRAATLAALTLAAFSTASAAAPAAHAGAAAWAAEKLAGGVVSGIGGMGLGKALSAIGIGNADFAAIRRDLAEIKRQIAVVSDQVRQLSGQLTQTGCNTATHQLGDVRTLATDGWERYESLLNRADAQARAAGLPAVRDYLLARDFRAARKRIHTALASPGAGAQSLLQLCGGAIEQASYPFITTETTKKVRAFVDDWQFLQVRLAILEAERLMLLGDPEGAKEEAQSLLRDLAAEDRLVPDELPQGVFLDVRTNLLWNQKVEAETWDKLTKDGSIPTMAQLQALFAAPPCCTGSRGEKLPRWQWLEDRAGADFGTLITSSKREGVWSDSLDRSLLMVGIRMASYYQLRGSSEGKTKTLAPRYYNMVMRFRPRKPEERWSVDHPVACTAGSGRAAEASQPATVRRVGSTFLGTPANDTIAAGAGVEVHSGKGSDVIRVGSQSRVHAGACADVVYVTGAGTTVRAGTGDDTIRLTGGSSVAYGEAGNDDLRGGRGDDRLYGGSGQDTLRGGRGDDRLYGGPGQDTLRGGRGNDRLSGGSGRDLLDGGRGDDRIIAADGARDIVLCGPGDDTAIVDRKDVVRGCERVIVR
jgi:hypothetical protein